MGPAESKYKTSRLSFRLIMFFALLIVIYKLSPPGTLVGIDNRPRRAYGARSDLNGDGVVDLEDLKIFSSRHLKKDWDQVDWCLWLEQDDKKKKQLGKELRDFIIYRFQCGQEPNEGPLAVKHTNRYPTRLAWGPGGNLYVSDAKVGSVFIYEPNLTLIGELKGLSEPLGVVVDNNGNIYVGNNGRDNVEVYNSAGEKIAIIGQGTTKMPNELSLDRDGNIYVVDSLSNVVWVYNPDGTALSNIGNGQLNFPVAVEIAYRDDGSGQEVGELYVADQMNYLIKVFDLQGNLLRSYGGQVTQGMMGWKWQGKFVSLQSLAIDGLGRVHATDCYMNKVQILDPNTGDYISSYGQFGTEPGLLNLPLDIALFANDPNHAVIANTENGRVEIIDTTP